MYKHKYLCLYNILDLITDYTTLNDDTKSTFGLVYLQENTQSYNGKFPVMRRLWSLFSCKMLDGISKY